MRIIVMVIIPAGAGEDTKTTIKMKQMKPYRIICGKALSNLKSFQFRWRIMKRLKNMPRVLREQKR